MEEIPGEGPVGDMDVGGLGFLVGRGSRERRDKGQQVLYSLRVLRTDEYE